MTIIVYDFEEYSELKSMKIGNSFDCILWEINYDEDREVIRVMKNRAHYDAILLDNPPALLQSNQVEASQDLQRQDFFLQKTVIGKADKASIIVNFADFVDDNGLPELLDNPEL